MEIPWVLEGVNLFIIHSFLFNILFYLQLFWLWMEEPRREIEKICKTHVMYKNKKWGNRKKAGMKWEMADHVF